MTPPAHIDKNYPLSNNQIEFVMVVTTYRFTKALVYPADDSKVMMSV